MTFYLEYYGIYHRFRNAGLLMTFPRNIRIVRNGFRVLVSPFYTGHLFFLLLFSFFFLLPRFSLRFSRRRARARVTSAKNARVLPGPRSGNRSAIAPRCAVCGHSATDLRREAQSPKRKREQRGGLTRGPGRRGVSLDARRSQSHGIRREVRAYAYIQGGTVVSIRSQ